MLLKRLLPGLICLLLVKVIPAQESNVSSSLHIDSLENLLKPLDGAEKLAVLIELSTSIQATSLEKSRNYAQEALKLSITLNDKKASAQALTQLSYVYLFLERMDSALVNARKALKLYEELGDTDGIVDINNRYAYLYLKLGSYDKAMAYSLKSVRLHEETGNRTHSERTLNNLGLVYQGLQEYEKSLEYFQASLDYCYEVQNEPFAALVLNNIGIVHAKQGDYKNGLVFFEQAFSINDRLGDLFHASSNLGNIGGAHKVMGDYDKAIIYYQKSLDILEGNTSNSLALISLGEVHTILKEFKIAEKYLNKSLELHGESNSQYKSLCYKSFSEIYKAQGNDTKALEYYELYIRLKDSAFNEESDRRLAMLQVSYETDKKEQQIMQQEEKLRVQKNLLISLLLGLAAILVFSGIIHAQKTRLKKANMELAFKNLEIVETEKRAGPPSRPRDQKLTQEISKYTGSSLDETQKQELLNNILFAMESEKVFTQDNMNLSNLAKHLDTNSKYVSQVINERINKNFSTFLNEYRVKEARFRLSQPESGKLTIEAIATEVGFQSISTFNTAFKKYTGITPSFFMKSVQEPS